MTWNGALEQLMEDTVTVEPFAAETSARVQTFGAAVTYKALVERGVRRVIGLDGREVVSNTQVTIPNRVLVDPRSRVTLPVGFAPRQPPIVGISLGRGLGLDHTVLYLG